MSHLYTLSFLLLLYLTSIATLKTFHEFKALKKIISTETFNVNFHNKSIKFALFCFFYFSLYIYIYTYIRASLHRSNIKIKENKKSNVSKHQYKYSRGKFKIMPKFQINDYTLLQIMVNVAGIGHGDTSSNPGLIAFHIAQIPLGKVWIQLFSLQLWVNSRAD